MSLSRDDWIFVHDAGTGGGCLDAFVADGFVLAFRPRHILLPAFRRLAAWSSPSSGLVAATFGWTRCSGASWNLGDDANFVVVNEN